MHDLEDRLRQLSDNVSREAPSALRPTPHALRRIRVGRAVRSGAAFATVAALLIGGFAVRSAVQTDAAPLPPADREQQVIEKPASPRQVVIIRHVVDSINARDTSAFIESFTSIDTDGDGDSNSGFSPRGIFTQGCVESYFDIYAVDSHHLSLTGDGGCLGPMDEDRVDKEGVVGAWMRMNELWDLEAEVIACSEVDDAPITHRFAASDVRVLCEVATRWHKLSLEIREGWIFEFDGAKLYFFQLSGSGSLLHLDPAGRALPLGYDELEEWERWLAANHPENAARYLNRRVMAPPEECETSESRDYCQQWNEAGPRLGPLLWPAEEDWSISGSMYRPDGLIPYDPAFAEEIETSIQEYLESR